MKIENLVLNHRNPIGETLNRDQVPGLAHHSHPNPTILAKKAQGLAAANSVITELPVRLEKEEKTKKYNGNHFISTETTEKSGGFCAS